MLMMTASEYRDAELLERTGEGFVCAACGARETISTLDPDYDEYIKCEWCGADMRPVRARTKTADWVRSYIDHNEMEDHTK
jgi:DNA-directed RNA polymerase subunit RPC12/RpoP